MLLQAVLAALVGAFFYAVAASLQHHEAIRATSAGVVNPRLLWQLAHRPLWLAGIAATGIGAALHLVALSRGPLTIIQPLGVTGLVFAVPLAAWLGRRRVRRRDLTAAVVVLAGLAAVLRALSLGQSDPRLVSTEPVLALLAVAGGAAGLLAAAAAALRRLRSLLLAAAAGVAFGTTSALARLAFQLDGHPGTNGAIVLAGTGIALLAPFGFLLTQSAYRSGGFAAALATVTVVDPLTAGAAGVLVLREQVPTSLGQFATLGLGAVAVTVGIGVLARSPAHAPQPPRSPHPAATTSPPPPPGSPGDPA